MNRLTLVLLVSLGAIDGQEVTNILSTKCLGCHTVDWAQKAVVAGKPDESLLYQLVVSGKMPKAGEKLGPAELGAVRKWIEAGAPKLDLKPVNQREFWSFRSPQKAAGGSIDGFVQAKLTEKGLTANPQADHRTLIRRLHFDLTGLAPKTEDYSRSYEETIDHLLGTPQYAERWARHWLDVVRFGETDGGEHNYERFHAWPYRDYVIDAFRTDKPYTQFVKEQIAGDVLEPTNPKMIAATGFLVAGPWDQVSAELNKDKILAATARVDELDDMATTTFHTFQALTVNCARCHDHKFDPIPSKDFYRLTAVYSGVTFGTRKVASEGEQKAYDAKTQPIRDRLAEVIKQINDIEDPVRARLLVERYKAFDEQRKSAPRRIPLNPVWNRNAFAVTHAKKLRLVVTGHQNDRAQLEHLELIPAGIAVKEWKAAAKASADAPVVIELANPEAKPVDRMSWWSDQKTGRNIGMPKVFRLEASEDGVSWRTLCSSLDHVQSLELELPKVDPSELPESGALLAKRLQIEKELAAIPEPMKLYAAKPKAMDKAFLLERGSVAKPKEEVSAGGLSAVRQLSPDFEGETDGERRLALANWIANEKNPLTARVIVNRVWYHHFGNGIVNTPSDFGLNGDRPSHQELLDWLAVSFMENGWSIKWLHRQILKSEAYRRSSSMHEASFAADADNRMVWRMPLKRMDAEMLRDSVLQASGQLRMDQVGGPSFFLQKKKERGAYIYETLDNDGPEVWRRAIYRFVVRGGERIMMDSFDCPDPAVATPQRTVSNTPVQALTLLNNAFVIRQSELLAERLRKQSGADIKAQVARAYELLYGRRPNATELSRGEEFIGKQSLTLYVRALFNTNEFLYVP